MDSYKMCSNVDPGIEDKLEDLKKSIESLRIELHNTVESDGSFSNKESTYCISNRLDRLIVQFLKVKEQVEVDKGRA